MVVSDSLERVLVIGATGNIGRHVVGQLAARGRRVRAMTRNVEGAGLPEGVEVVQGDLTVPGTLDRSLEGVEAVFLVWTAPAAAAEAALERIARRARRVVFLSAPLKTPHPFFQQPNPGRERAMHMERLIEGSGMAWTFLRPGMFALNARHFWGPQIRAGDVVRWPYLMAPTAPIDERDIAAVAVRVLGEAGHAGRDYVLTGPESLTQGEQIAIIGEGIGRRLRIEEVSAEEARRTCLAGMPASAAGMLLDAWAAAVGQPAYVTGTVGELTGAGARAFSEWVRENGAAFGA